MIVLKKKKIMFLSTPRKIFPTVLFYGKCLIFVFVLFWSGKKSRIWGLSSETETPSPVQLQSPLSLSSFKERSTKAQKWKMQRTRRGCSDEVSASPGSTGNLIMKVVLAKIPAWFKQTPEAPIVRIINHSPGWAPGLFCW